MEKGAGKGKVNVTQVKAEDLLTPVVRMRPKALGKMDMEKASAVLRAALMQLARRIEAVPEGAVKVAGLGTFRVRQVEREKEGVKTAVRRVIFKPAAPKAGKKPAAAAK